MQPDGIPFLPASVSSCAEGWQTGNEEDKARDAAPERVMKKV